jgi:hypothetical protein
MPIISTIGSSSSTGFGLFRGRPLITYTFPSGTSTFTVPVNVTTIRTAIGKGADGTPVVWTAASNAAPAYAIGYASGSGGSVSITWGDLYSQIQSHQSTVNAGGSGERSLYIPTYLFQIFVTGSSTNLGIVTTFSNYETIRGTASIVSENSPPSSGTITYAQVLNNSRGYGLSGLEVKTGGTTGANTTGFGLTFPGGVQTAATTTTFSNVSVTPGTTYTIVNNGSLTITY